MIFLYLYFKNPYTKNLPSKRSPLCSLYLYTMSYLVPSFTTNFSGPIIIVGFGSIGKALLPLIKRHIITTAPITIIAPDDSNRHIAEKYGAHFLHMALTKENYETTLSRIIGDQSIRSLIVSVSNEVSSKDLTRYAAHHNAHYIDTVVEPWPGFYFNNSLSKSDQSNYTLRESLQSIKKELEGSPTAISCCGANPGMVSWLLKEALLNLAKNLGRDVPTPTSRKEWAILMRDLGVKGVHIAERDTQVANIPQTPGVFQNTWSATGCMAECLQPAELGWGTHENAIPDDGHNHESGSKTAIYLDQPGGVVKVRTWTPTEGPHFGYLVTHNEAISISDYFTIKEGDTVTYRPTCHYAYHPSDATVASLEELFNERAGVHQEEVKIFTEDEIVSGADELGVLLYGHEKGAYWYGSRLTIEEARELAPHQNATGLQVSSAVLAGIFYCLKHPQEGLIETDEMDYKAALEIQRPYLGKVYGAYTDWKPNQETSVDDAWQFSSIRMTE